MTAPSFSLERGSTGDGRLLLRFAGRLALEDGRRLWEELRPLAESGQRAVLDLSGLHQLEGGAIALLVELQARAQARGGALDFEGAGDVCRELEGLYGCENPSDCLKSPLRRIGILEQIGRAAAVQIEEARAILAFLGDLVFGAARGIRNPRTVQWGDLGHLMERAGADGLPIIALINFLVGAVLGLQGAIQLHRFGADPFLANLVGLSMLREIAPLMTAILIAGRSGAAYAAELGTMAVSEEIDALCTLGQDPQRFLVIPRLLALFFVTPILTILADVAGVLGGLAVAMFYLRIPPVAYYQQLVQGLELSDLLTGLVKSGAFAILIGLVACQRGLNARGGAASVGRSTTSAVVIVLFGLVVLDSAFTLVFSALGI
ncbi:MAG: MlaE family lipid ABC transporter permease subunit [Planctomycetota bacterium]